tara:strand:+ start:34 stop:420 length:387 start_codon:yes stop_codon:yes gene_type:complete
MGWYGQIGVNNPLSGSATHHGQQAPVSLVVNGESIAPHPYATAPAVLKVTEPPSHVIINNNGTYTFAYNLTQSIGHTLVHAQDKDLFITASVVEGDGTPIKLDISPSAWNGGADANVGDVTFVYKKKI